MDLSQLQFGKPAAERDLEGLKEYFIESPAFTRVRSGEKRLLIGNRGAGKSAIFKIVAQREIIAGNVVLELAPEDYSYQMLSETLASETEGSWAKAGAYAAAWKYLILVLAMKKLAKLPKHKQRTNKEEKQMFRYLRDNHANVAEKPIDILLSYLRRLEGFKVGPVEAGIKTRELTRLYKLEELDPFIPIIRQMCQRSRVSVFVDELDQGWDASEDAKAFVAGLFQACNTLNRLSENFRVYVSLRQELFDNIPALYDDTQKYRDLFDTIAWDHDMLRQLLLHRIRHFVPDLRNESDGVTWSAVFERSESYRYMLERSLYRPRELILYATEALDLARRGRRRVPISHETIQDVELNFSKERMRDLAAEHRFQYPDLDLVFGTFRARSPRWKRGLLLDHLLEVSVGEALRTEDRPEWLDGMDPERLLDVLWRVGFIMVETNSESRGGWRPGSPDDPSVDTRSAELFRVLPLFNRALALRS